MIVRVLGSAAGGGVPQWNCACANCTAARAGMQPRRLQSSLAVGERDRWLLLNCSPDIAAQIESFAPLQPRSTRGTPITGMLLTDANVDHIGGLATLRQSGTHAFTVRSTAVVREIAIAQPAFAPFGQPPHRWVETPLGELCDALDSEDLLGGAIEVRAIPVRGVTPGYAGRRDVRGAVAAYEIRSRADGKTLLFAPVFAAIDAPLRDAIRRADVAFLDGSFYTDDELIAAGLMEKTARHLGHQPVGGGDGTLAQLDGSATRAIFTHLNNSNPMLEASSPAARAIANAGAALAYDGMELVV